VIDENDIHIYFNHHYDLESFEKAMHLPCAICRLAYTYAQNSSPALSRAKTIGCYTFGREDNSRALDFYETYSLHPYSSKPSRTLILEPWPSE
jgi:hypothetical protein